MYIDKTIVNGKEYDILAISAEDIHNRLCRMAKEIEAIEDFLFSHCTDTKAVEIVACKTENLEWKMNDLVCECLSYSKPLIAKQGSAETKEED